MRVLVLGASGMVGNGIFRYLQKQSGLDVFGTSRRMMYESDIFSGVYTEEAFATTIQYYYPDVVINCIGVTKQMVPYTDEHQVISANAALPHYLARVCTAQKARLIHISTDCVFSGNGAYMYSETSEPDAKSLYGRSKHIGEVIYDGHLTIRTSFIGHGLFKPKLGLVDWFLGQKEVEGYAGHVFTGFPVVVFAKVLFDHVLFSDISGLYHIAAEPITKCHLLNTINTVYARDIVVNPTYKNGVSNMALDGSKFNKETGFVPDTWRNMIKEMHDDFLQS